MINRLHLPRIVHRVIIRAGRPRVFDAISKQSGLEAWLCSEAFVDCRVGGTLRLCWRDFGPDALNVTDGGDVVECSPPCVFAFEWRPGRSKTIVRFDLKERGE